MKSLISLVFLSAAAFALPSSNNVCKNPIVRKEWRDLSYGEKKDFIDAVKCLGTDIPPSPDFYRTGWGEGDYGPVKPASERHYWDDLTYSHMDTNARTHFVGNFLPWHRMFIATAENALRKYCNYQGAIPYWDWSLDVADLKNSPVFSPDPVIGFGTWGTAESNWTVTDGAFANWTRAYPWPHTIARRYEPQPFHIQDVYPLKYNNPEKYANTTVTKAAIKALIEGYKGDAFGFQFAIEGERCEGLHSGMHYLFGPQTNVGEPGSDMGDASHSPNDPLFFLNHANIDRIWQKWKDYDPANARIVGGGTIKNLTLYDQYPQGLPPAAQASDWLATNGLTPNVTIGDLFSTTQGYTCYTYQDPLSEAKDEY